MKRISPLPNKLSFQAEGFTYSVTPYMEGPGEIAYFEVFIRRDETENTFAQDIGKERFVKEPLP